MEGRPYNEVAEERNLAKKLFTSEGFAVCDPLRHKHVQLKEGKTVMDLAKASFEVQQIVARDEADIRASDGLLVLTGDTPSSGTWFEFAFAHYVVKIPVVVVAPKLRDRMNKKEAAFEWTGAKASKVVSSIEEAVVVFKWVFGNRLYLPHSELQF